MAGELIRLMPAAEPEEVGDTRPAPQPRVFFYVDADNQSAQCAAELVSLFGPMSGGARLSAVVAGNNKGRQINVCSPNAAGLYSATAVGQGLSRLGFDAKARRAFLASASVVKVEGKAAAKAYRF